MSLGLSQLAQLECKMEMVILGIKTFSLSLSLNNLLMFIYKVYVVLFSFFLGGGGQLPRKNVH